MDLPFSQAAHNNRGPILTALRRLLPGSGRVLEVGAGTGQHAVYFAQQFPRLTWQPTEHPGALAMLRLRCAAEGPVNLAEPVALDIAERPWPVVAPDAVYTANTLHIVSPHRVEAFFAACGEQAAGKSALLVYGPFNYGGAYTAESNARFDEWLKARDPASAIRDFEWVDALATAAGYELAEDVPMPANNRLLCWRLRDPLP